jgi:hypothetical protein
MSSYRFELSIKDITHKQAHKISSGLSGVVEKMLGKDALWHGDIVPLEDGDDIATRVVLHRDEPEWAWTNEYGDRLEIRETALWHSDIPDLEVHLKPILSGLVLSWGEIYQVASYMKNRSEGASPESSD